MFYALEAQTQFLNNITNMETVVDYSHLTPNEARLLKVNTPSMKKQSMMMMNSTGNTISMDNLDISAKKFIESEFNHSKYLTIKGEEMERRSKMSRSSQRASLISSDMSPKNRMKTDPIPEEGFDEQIKQAEEDHKFQEDIHDFVKKHIETIVS
jgi:hypothetical protein